MALFVPEYLQTKTYSAQRDRYLLQTGAPLQEGVVAAFASSDLLAVQRVAGANMSVDVPFGVAFVAGDDTWAQGLYHVVNDNTVNVATQLSSGAAWQNGDATNPRIDQIVIQVNDTTDGGRSADNAVFGVVQGTPTAGATLDNRNGAATLPNTSLRLVDVLVPAGATSVVTANIRDRRPWARGLHGWRQVFATVSTAVPTSIAWGVPMRVEVSGGTSQLWARFAGTSFCTTQAHAPITLALKIDGHTINANQATVFSAPQANTNYTFNSQVFPYDTSLSAPLTPGSHLIEPYFGSPASATIQIIGSTSPPLSLFEVWEDIRGGGYNGTA